MRRESAKGIGLEREISCCPLCDLLATLLAERTKRIRPSLRWGVCMVRSGRNTHRHRAFVATNSAPSGEKPMPTGLNGYSSS